MSKYTTEVRFICESLAGLDSSVGYADVNRIIDTSAPKIFNFNYEMFDESYKPVLQKKILKHYYTREIGFETVGLWKLKLDTKLNEILPYYNQLYKSELLEFNPLYTNVITTDHHKDYGETGNTSGNEKTSGQENGTLTHTAEDITEFVHIGTEQTKGKNTESGTDKTSGSTTSGVNVAGTTTTTDLLTGETSQTTGTSGTTTDRNENLYSDTPQGGLTGVETSTYLTEARLVTDSTTNSQNTTVTGSNKQNDTAKTTTSSETQGVDTTTGKTEYGKAIDTTEQIIYDIHDKTTFTASDGDATAKTTSGTKDNTGSHKLDSLEDYIEHVTGYGGVSASDLLQKFRETFLNIDLMIINELEPLFMQLW